MRVLHVSPTYYPAVYWGGPIFSVAALNDALSRFDDVEINVLTTDAAGPKLSQRLSADEMSFIFSAKKTVIYARRFFLNSVSLELLWNLHGAMKLADVVHLTGAYSFPTLPVLLLARLNNKPVVWSPRGAFQAAQEWNGVRRPGLKRLWDWCCEILLSNKVNACLHATSDSEMLASQARLPGVDVVVVPNGVDVPVECVLPRDMDGDFRLLFMGRLDPKKGLDNLIQALAALNDSSVVLEVCGTGESGYLEMLMVLVSSLNLQARVKFSGQVNGERKSQAFLSADVCVVPSHNENFCLVVAESLAHGLPVIASTGTPWAELEAHGCGLWVGNEPASLVAAIEKIRGMDRPAMGMRGRAWMQAEFGWDRQAAKMKSVYLDLLSKGGRHVA